MYFCKKNNKFNQKRRSLVSSSLFRMEFPQDRFHEKPKEWREGQFVFNVVNRLYDVARDVQFDYGVDCYYNDDKIEEFLIRSVEVINCYGK